MTKKSTAQAPGTVLIAELVYREQAAAEFRRLHYGDVPSPKFKPGDVVLASFSEGRQYPGVVTGMSLRIGGWHYELRTVRALETGRHETGAAESQLEMVDRA